jgi:hypothetical protein
MLLLFDNIIAVYMIMDPSSTPSLTELEASLRGSQDPAVIFSNLGKLFFTQEVNYALAYAISCC